jgi:hypothetical protein
MADLQNPPEEQSSIDPELAKHRRNLMLLSAGLLIFELSGGRIENVSMMGGGFKLANAEVAVYAAYMALFYFLWRYWVYALPKHNAIRAELEAALERLNCYKRLIGPHIDSFRKESGISSSESIQKMALEGGKEGEFVPFPIERKIRKGLYRRVLSLTVADPRGDFHPNRIDRALNFWKYEDAGC